MTPWFFGYGSLVNRDTHIYPQARPAVLRGWRREWLQTTTNPVAMLSARPDPGGRIEGLIAQVPGADWTALDLRESHYARHDVSAETEHDVTGPASIAVYRVEEAPVPPEPAPILLSYLDVVLQGYLREFGMTGMERFIETTDGWETSPILNDRAAPRYPRHQPLTENERARIDAVFTRLPVAIEAVE